MWYRLSVLISQFKYSAYGLSKMKRIHKEVDNILKPYWHKCSVSGRYAMSFIRSFFTSKFFYMKKLFNKIAQVLLICCCLPATHISAQVLMLPSTADQLWYTNPNLPWGLNTSVITYGTSGNSALYASVLSSLPGTYKIRVNDFPGTATVGTVSTATVAGGVDVILGDNKKVPKTSFILAVAYSKSSTMEPRVDFYRVNRIPTLTIQFITTVAIPGYAANTVHLDVIADYNDMTTTGWPLCDNFMITWDDFNTNTVWVAEGNLNTKTIGAPTLVANGHAPDVAGIRRGTPPLLDDVALITYTDAGNLYYSEWGATAGLSPQTTLDAGVGAPQPRIDAFDDFGLNSHPSISQYKIVAQVLNSNPVNTYEIRTYDNLNLGFVVSDFDDFSPIGYPAPFPNHYHNLHPCVSNWGPSDYAILHVAEPYQPGYINQNILVTEPVDFTSPTTLWANTYYKVNDVGGTFYKATSADYYNSVSSSPNNIALAEPTLFAWCAFNGTNWDLKYKVSQNLPSFKTAPTSIANTRGVQDWKVYPNPTAGNLSIELPGNMEEVIYQVSDIAGRLVMTGTFDRQLKNIDVSKLEKAVYFIKITRGTEEVYTSRFIKI